MTPRETLYKDAFEYKKSKLWKKLYDNQVFAVRLSSGETGYVCVMGRMGFHQAIALYIGREGVNSLRRSNAVIPGFEDFEDLISQHCLQLEFGNSDDLFPGLADEVRAFKKEYGIRVGGKNAFPQFVRYQKYRFPVPLDNDADIISLDEAVQVCIKLAEKLDTSTPEELGIGMMDPGTSQVPLFSISDGTLIEGGMVPIPELEEEKYEPVIFRNEVAAHSLRKAEKYGSYSCELLRLREPIQNDPDEVPFFPLFCLIVDVDDAAPLPAPLSKDCGEDMEAFLNGLAQEWIDNGICPSEIFCRDDRTYAFLKDFCSKTGIRLEYTSEELPELDEAEDSFLSFMDEYDDGTDEGFSGKDEELDPLMLEIIALSVLGSSDEELDQMPEEAMEGILSMSASGMFPDDMNKKIRDRLFKYLVGKDEWDD